jgi:hypothetical protein
MNLDFTTDLNPKDYNFCKGILGLDLSKAASTTVDLPDHAFAGYRSFPIDTTDNILASAVYAHSSPNPVDVSVIENIKQAAVFVGLEDTYNKIVSTISNLRVKSASADHKEPEYAMYVEDNSTTYKVYPINNKVEVIESSIKLANDKYKMTRDWFVDASRAIVKKAEAFELNFDMLAQPVVEAGVEREFNVKYADISLRDRLKYVPQEDAEIYKDLWNSAKQASSRQERDEILNLIVDMDHATGLTEMKDVEDAYSCFYSGMPTSTLDKLAGAHICAEDVMIPVGSFLAVEDSLLSSTFAPKTASALIGLKRDLEEAKGDVAVSFKVAKAFDDLSNTVRAELYGLILNADEAAVRS